MKLRWKRIGALALSTLVVGSSFTGCGNKTSESSSSEGKKSKSTVQVQAEPTSDEKAEEKVNLVFWTMWDGGDVAIAKEMFDEYNNTHPNVNIEFQQQDFNQYYTKMQTALLGGTGPDFAVSHIGGFVNGLKNQDNLLPIDEMAQKYGVDIQFDKYTKEVMNTSQIDGKYYAVPADNLVRTLMYNKEILKDTGVLDAEGNLIMEPGYDGFMKMLETVKQKRPDVETLALTMRPPQLVLGWLTLYSQMGGENFIDLDANKATFDEEKALAALKAYREIYEKYVPAKLAPPADFDMFKTGKAAFYIDGAWQVAASGNVLGDKMGVTKFPQLFEKDAHVVTNHGFIIPAKEGRTDAQTKAVLEFIKWWGENNWKWSKAGHLPAYEPVIETEEFKALPYPKFYQETLNGAVPIPVIPNANLHQLPEVTDPIQVAMLGDITPEEAIKMVKDNLDQLLPKLQP